MNLFTTRPWLLPISAALVSAVLLWLAFFPANLGFLGWVALIPYLLLIARPSARWVYPSAFLGGLLFGTLATQWIRLAAPAMYLAWLGLALLLAVHFLLFVLFTRWLVHGTRVPLLLAAPVVWTALEFGRAHIDIGFAWYLLGHTQHDYLPMIQAADVFGAYGVSFLLVLKNVVLFQGVCWLMAIWKPAWLESVVQVAASSTRALGASLGLVAILLVASLVYGNWRLSQDAFAQGPKVALVQGNVPQEIRNDPNQGPTQDRHFNELGRLAANEGAELIVFPETSFTFHWLLVPIEQQGDLSFAGKSLLQFNREFAAQKPKDWNAALLLGINSLVAKGTEDFRPFNSAILLNRDGSMIGKYDKCCRVPFGEYLPFVESLPFIKWFSPYEFNYGIYPGQELTFFELPGGKAYRFGVLICYEDSVPHLARRFMQQQTPEQPLDFFLNISNDGWFRCSEEHEQHLVAARFRAVENRRALARAVNVGISTVIDGNGRIIALPGPTWRDSKGVSGIVTAYMPIDQRSSLYVWWGDVLPLACVLLTLIGFVVAVVRWRWTKASGAA